MAAPKRYTIYCSTEAVWKFTWSTTAPTVCPTNSGHAVQADSVAITSANTSNFSQSFLVAPGAALILGYCAAPSVTTPGTVTRFYGAPTSRKNSIVPCQYIDATYIDTNAVVSCAQTDYSLRYFSRGSLPGGGFFSFGYHTNDSITVGYEMVRGVTSTDFVRVYPYSDYSGDWSLRVAAYYASGGGGAIITNTTFVSTPITTTAELYMPIYDAAVMGTARVAVAYPTINGVFVASFSLSSANPLIVTHEGTGGVPATPYITAVRGVSITALDSTRVMLFGNLDVYDGLHARVFVMSTGTDPFPGPTAVVDNVNVISASNIASCLLSTDTAIVAYTASVSVLANGYVAVVKSNTLASGSVDVASIGVPFKFSSENANVTMPRISMCTATSAVVAYTDLNCPACGFVTGLSISGTTVTSTATCIFSYNVGSYLALLTQYNRIECFYTANSTAVAALNHGDYIGGVFTFEGDTRARAPIGIALQSVAGDGSSTCEVATRGQVGGYHDLLRDEPCYAHSDGVINTNPSILNDNDLPYFVGVAISDTVIDLQM